MPFKLIIAGSRGLNIFMNKQYTIYAVTGTFHGSLVEASSEGEARRIFHMAYNGESIIYIVKRGYYALLA